MNVKRVLISFIPWVVFSVLVQRAGVEAAGFAALLAALVGGSLAFAGRGAGVKLLDIVGTATFAVLATAAFVGGPGVEEWVADYGLGAATVILGVVMLGSTLLVPFTEQYARKSTPKEYWHTAPFRSVNRRISATWGGAILLMSLVTCWPEPSIPPRRRTPEPAGWSCCSTGSSRCCWCSAR